MNKLKLGFFVFCLFLFRYLNIKNCETVQFIVDGCLHRVFTLYETGHMCDKTADTVT